MPRRDLDTQKQWLCWSMPQAEVSRHHAVFWDSIMFTITFSVLAIPTSLSPTPRYDGSPQFNGSLTFRWQTKHTFLKCSASHRSLQRIND
ncbi:hypothetical protein J6590_027655 [Homalodisca vitripennis]|nr:hypothetical protein J6590_027655 [Homalodisca vitripennis]